MDAIFGVHNRPGIAAGKLAGRAGALYAAADKFEIVVSGKDGHAARPHLTIDPVLVAAQIIVAVQITVARNTNPKDAAVVSIFHVDEGPEQQLIAHQDLPDGTVRHRSRAAHGTHQTRPTTNPY